MTTPITNLQLGALIPEDWDWTAESDDDLNAEAAVFASYINPFLASMDPIMISGTTFSGSTRLTSPPTTTHTAISVTSCGLHT